MLESSLYNYQWSCQAPYYGGLTGYLCHNGAHRIVTMEAGLAICATMELSGSLLWRPDWLSVPQWSTQDCHYVGRTGHLCHNGAVTIVTMKAWLAICVTMELSRLLLWMTDWLSVPQWSCQACYYEGLTGYLCHIVTKNRHQELTKEKAFEVLIIVYVVGHGRTKIKTPHLI